MNDTTQASELVDKVADVIQEAAVESSGVEDVWQWPDGWHTPINLAAKEVIALVTAARDAEIRESMLSDEVIDRTVRITNRSPAITQLIILGVIEALRLTAAGVTEREE